MDTRAEAYGEKPPEKGVIRTGKKVYIPLLPSTYKEKTFEKPLTMTWSGYSDNWRSLKQEKEPLLPRDNVVEFDFWNNTKDLEKNIKLQVCPNE